MDQRTIVITGANTGIGLETAVSLASAGERVIIACRNPAKADAAVAEISARAASSDVSAVPLDLASLASVRACAAELGRRCERIDVLINNAGLIQSGRETTVDGFETTFGVNHLGHFLLTDLLRERLVASAPARVVTVSSIAHRLAGGMSWSDLQHERGYNGTVVYNESKLANVLFTVELARRLEGTGVVANCLHPGAVRTGFGNAEDTRGLERLGVLLGTPFFVTAHRGAQPIVRLAAWPQYATVTGGYYVGGYTARCAKRNASAAGRDPVAAQRLWAVSEELLAGVTG